MGRAFPLGKKSFIQIIVWFILFITESHGDSRVMLGGYVPFASSMQLERDGGANMFSFSPIWGVGTSIPLEEINNNFAPMLGAAFHKKGAGDDYKKSTFYLLGDFEMEWGDSWYFRYGVGFFATFIQGEGGVVLRENGSEQIEFHRPARNIVTYNMTLNLGWDYHFSRRWFVRMETFVFSILNGHARNMSYMIVLGHKYRL